MRTSVVEGGAALVVSLVERAFYANGFECTRRLRPCSEQQFDALPKGGLAGVEEEVVDIYAVHRLTRVAFDLGLKPAVSLGLVFVASELSQTWACKCIGFLATWAWGVVRGGWPLHRSTPSPKSKAWSQATPPAWLI